MLVIVEGNTSLQPHANFCHFQAILKATIRLELQEEWQSARGPK